MSSAPPLPAELWDRIPPDVQAALLLLFARHEQRIAQLEAQVAELQARLNQNSANSSRPPSSDPPNLKPAPRKPASGRKRGGQQGHAFARRPLAPDRLIRQRIPCVPTRCRCCGLALHGADPQPRPHQVAELPPVEPEVIEYQVHRLRCDRCGTTTAGPLPEGVPAGHFGPRLQATLGVLAGSYRLSKRLVAQLARDLFGLSISTGAISQLEQGTAAALAGTIAQIEAEVRKGPVHLDETSWRQGGRRAWLWVAVTLTATLFSIRWKRDANGVRELLGPGYRGVVHSDRYSAYAFLPARRRQLCWAHLRRDFQAVIDRGGQGRATGEVLLGVADDLFYWWHCLRDEVVDRPFFEQRMARVKGAFRRALRQGQACGCARTERLCAELQAKEAGLWTFLGEPGVEPTNNRAERALRHAVCWRKTSYGTDSEGGSRFVERMLSVVATCRQVERSVLEYVTACVQAWRHGEDTPNLFAPTPG